MKDDLFNDVLNIIKGYKIIDDKIDTGKKQITKDKLITQLKFSKKFTNDQIKKIIIYLNQKYRQYRKKQRTDENNDAKHDLLNAVLNDLYNHNLSYSNGLYLIDNNIYIENEIIGLISTKYEVNDRSIIEKILWAVNKLPKFNDKFANIRRMVCDHIASKQIPGESQYLKSMDLKYPNNKFRNILHNIICNGTKNYIILLYDKGRGGTGKSEFLNILKMIIGEKFISNVSISDFSNDFVLTSLLGKFLNIGDDSGCVKDFNVTSQLKSIVTKSRVNINLKHKDRIESNIFSKIILASNYIPVLNISDGGVNRRFFVHKMNEEFSSNEKMPQIDSEEIGHIIYEAINSNDIEDIELNYFNSIVRNNVVFRFLFNFTYYDYLRDLNNIDVFINEKYKNYLTIENPAILYNQYKKWSEFTNEKVLSKPNFIKTLFQIANFTSNLELYSEIQSYDIYINKYEKYEKETWELISKFVSNTITNKPDEYYTLIFLHNIFYNVFNDDKDLIINCGYDNNDNTIKFYKYIHDFITFDDEN